MSNICVYCSSSNSVAPGHFELAREVGGALGQRGHALVFGGTDIGLMGALARSAKEAGARVIGVLPEMARGSRYVFPADEVIFATDLRARKAIMAERADAFLAMPGGFGTLDEVLEVIALKQLTLHQKPIALIDHLGFYAPLAALFEHLYREKFASAEHHRQLCAITKDVQGALGYFADYRAPELPIQWS